MALGARHFVIVKTILGCLAAIWLMGISCHAAIQISGDLTWQIKQPVCTFKLDGAIVNWGPSGSVSGTLKLVLWATPTAFPSRGYSVAEYTLGQLNGGYQLNDFTYKTTSSVPDVEGQYHFTIALLEYTASGWFTRDYVPTGTRRLEDGDLVTGLKWSLPLKPVITPPVALAAGKQLILTPRALDNFNAIVPGSRAPTTIVIRSASKARIAIAGKRVAASYTYSTGKNLFNGKRVSIGKLAIQPTDSSGSSDLGLFFLRAGGGVYRQTSQARTYWGIFRYE